MLPTADTTTAPAPEIDMLKIAAEADAQLDNALDTAAPAATATPAPAPQENTGLPPDEGKEAKKSDAPAAPDAAKKPEAAAKPDATKEPGKAETKFEKAKSEAERRDRSWKALEEEKAQVRAEKARIDGELATLRRELATMKQAKPTGPAKDEHGATAEDYTALAKRYAAEGNDELADAARARAEKLAKQTAPAASTGPATFESPEFQAEWKQHTQQLIAKEPELANPENPLVKAANGILTDPTYGRFFKSHPDGITAAVEVARLLQANAAAQQTTVRLKETEAALAKEKAEVTRLNALLQPRGSHPAGQPGGERKIEDMAPEEAQAAIMAMARAADRGELP